MKELLLKKALLQLPNLLMALLIASGMILVLGNVYSKPNQLLLLILTAGTAIALIVFSFFKWNKNNNLNLEAWKMAENTKNQELAKRLYLATNSAGIGIWDWDLVSNQITWDDAMNELYGVENGNNQSAFDNWNKLLHPDDKVRVTNEIRTAIAGGQTLDTSFKIIWQNGTIKSIKSKGFVNLNSTGKPINMIGFSWDQTEKALAEEKAKKSDNLFKHIVETSQEGIWLHDETMKTVFVNPTFSKIFGYTAEEMKHKNINDLIDTKFHALVQDKTENRKRGVAGSYELLCITKDKKQIWVNVSAAPINDENGQYAGSLAMLSDITERKLNEQIKDKVTQDLIQRNKNMEQFSYIVSHNLRAPLANILGCAELIQNDSINNTELIKIVNGMASSAFKLDEVIKDLNQILQVKNPMIEKRETISLNHIVKEIKHNIFDVMAVNKVLVQTDFSDVENIVSIKRYIYSIFYNLINNSIKYQKPEVNPIIVIKSKQLEKGVKLTFKDNGTGIDLQKEGDKIFGLYKRFHHDIEGKGIGLFMVKTQIETIGGTIQVASEVNKGTEFTIELPVG